MGIKWEHKIYEKDFSTKELYIEEIDRIIEKVREDYGEIKSKYDSTELHDMNSKMVTRLLDSTEEVLEAYKSIIEELEDLKERVR